MYTMEKTVVLPPLSDPRQVCNTYMLLLFGFLTLKVPNKNCSRRHFNFLSFVFRRK